MYMPSSLVYPPLADFHMILQRLMGYITELGRISGTLLFTVHCGIYWVHYTVMLPKHSDTIWKWRPHYWGYRGGFGHIEGFHNLHDDSVAWLHFKFERSVILRPWKQVLVHLCPHLTSGGSILFLWGEDRPDFRTVYWFLRAKWL